MLGSFNNWDIGYAFYWVFKLFPDCRLWIEQNIVVLRQVVNPLPLQKQLKALLAEVKLP